MEFIVRQPDCRTAYLQVETTRESPITGGPATKVDGRTKVGFGGGGEIEIAGIESQTAKSKIHDFAKSKKQAFGSAFCPPKQSSNASLIYCFESWLFHSHQCIDAIIPTRLDLRPALNGAPAYLALGLSWKP